MNDILDFEEIEDLDFEEYEEDDTMHREPVYETEGQDALEYWLNQK